MKIILVDLVNTLYDKDTGINKDMVKLLNSFKHNKVIVTNAKKDFLLELDLPFKVFTLEGNPRKENKEFFTVLIDHLKHRFCDVIYIEHKDEVVDLAKSLGINVFKYDSKNPGLGLLKAFLEENLA